MPLAMALFAVERIPADESGLAFYLERYKPFRLLSLESDPSAVGSALAREQAFDGERWRSRLLDPRASTFIAREIHDTRRIISSLGLVESDSVPEELKSRFSLVGPVLHWELNGVFTLPEARRRGAAAALMQAAKQHALEEARSRNCDGLLTVVVYTANSTAKLWYEKMGFALHEEGEDQRRPTSELALLLPRAR